MLLVMLLNFFVGLTDVYIAGFLGPEVQAVVGYVGQIYFFIIVVANALSIGTVAIASRAVGAGDKDEAFSAVRQSLFFGLLCSVALTASGLLLNGWLLYPAKFTGRSLVVAQDFLTIFALALMPNYLVIIANAVFRAGGEVKLSLVAMSVISVCNIALNFLLVFGIGRVHGIGYRGIALATAFSMAIGTAVCLALLARSRWRGLFRGRWHVTGTFVRRIIRVSWPSALIQLSWNAGNIVLYAILAELAKESITAMAALTNGLRVEAAIYLPAFAFHMSAAVLTGQNLGAGEPSRAERLGWKITLACVLFVSAMSLPVLIWPEAFSSLVSRDPAVIAETTRYLRITMLVEPFMAVSVVMGGCLQGAGDTRGAMTVIVMTLWGMRLPLAFLLAVVFGMEAVGVWIAMAVSMVVQSVGMTLRFRNGRWKELRP
jgi:putative MATE family efflux protein